MKITISDNKVTVQWFGKTGVCTFDELVERFKNASNENERRRLAIIFFGTTLMPVTPTKEKKIHTHSNRYNPEWDEQAQEDLDDILGPDPYTMFY